MTLNNKVIVIILCSVLLVISSIVPFRWLILNDVELTTGKSLADSGHRELLRLKEKVDKYQTVVKSMENNELLKDNYFDKKIRYHNEFGREGVEDIDNVLGTLYKNDTFFELERFSTKHLSNRNAAKTATMAEIKFVIEGDKRLVKP